MDDGKKLKTAKSTARKNTFFKKLPNSNSGIYLWNVVRLKKRCPINNKRILTTKGTIGDAPYFNNTYEMGNTNIYILPLIILILFALPVEWIP